AFFFIRYRRANAVERYVGFATAALFFFSILPSGAVPRGFASPFARYVLVFPVVILCATVVPLFAEIERTVARPIVGLMIGPLAIRPDARWVIVDRADNILWRHPLFQNAADWRRYIGRGWPSSDDLAVVKALLHDRRFRPIFYDPHLNQSVFARVR